MLICGCDAGLDGALAFLDPASRRIVAMIGMPTLKLSKGKGTKREIQARALALTIHGALSDYYPMSDPYPTDVHLFLEQVSGGAFRPAVGGESGTQKKQPRMGSVSAFQFGRWYGYPEMLAAVLGWPIEYVPPQKWKNALRVPAQKDDALARASQLMPKDALLWTPQRGVFDSKQASGRAEAALIALYGASVLKTAEQSQMAPLLSLGP